MKRIIITTGEPAGIGPDIVIAAAQRHWPTHLVAVGDRALLASRARLLGIELRLLPYSSVDQVRPHVCGTLPFIDIPLKTACQPGVLDNENAGYVLAQLEMATQSCLKSEFEAMVTAPVQKSAINAAGISFSGHTEFIGRLCGLNHTVMLLSAKNLRVALATTHLPLRTVPGKISTPFLEEKIRILHGDLKKRFDISNPRIVVLGLNPHAGEAGYIGREEIEKIAPACDSLRKQGAQVIGPIPADTAFIPKIRAQTDAYLAMYHDQGLPALKALGFGEAVNVTLGLPFIRTSVDHGTALDLAGSGNASDESMVSAIETAIGLH